jgi:hypothetical protein
VAAGWSLKEPVGIPFAGTTEIHDRSFPTMDSQHLIGVFDFKVISRFSMRHFDVDLLVRINPMFLERNSSFD